MVSPTLTFKTGGVIPPLKPYGVSTGLLSVRFTSTVYVAPPALPDEVGVPPAVQAVTTPSASKADAANPPLRANRLISKTPSSACPVPSPVSPEALVTRSITLWDEESLNSCSRPIGVRRGLRHRPGRADRRLRYAGAAAMPIHAAMPVMQQSPHSKHGPLSRSRAERQMRGRLWREANRSQRGLNRHAKTVPTDSSPEVTHVLWYGPPPTVVP
jgi:hypothetical protein